MVVTTAIVPEEHWTYDDRQQAWQQPRYFSGNVPFLCLVASRSSRITGRWVVPLKQVGNEYYAVREPRLFPYASPQILDEVPRDRRETLKSMISTLAEHVSVVELPLEPGFHEIGAFNEFGAFCESRHTHLVSACDFDLSRLPRSVRNHIASAAKDTNVVVHLDATQFAFERAVVDPQKAVIAQRRRLALRLAQDDRVTVLEGRRGDQVAGQLLIVRTGASAVFMHSWFDRAHSARGISTLLTMRGAEYCFREMGAARVDLEGSIIASVDEFMDGLGVSPVTYPMLYWARSATVLANRLLDSLDTPGRKKLADADRGAA